MIRLLTLLASLCGTSALAQSLDLPVHEAATTPGGHTFWFVNLPAAETIAINAPFPNDWGHRSMASVGASLVGPDMMFVGGSGDLDGRQLANALQDVSAFPAISADALAVTLRLTLNPDFLDEGTRLANQLITAPQFDPRWLGREVRQAKIDASEPRVEAGSKAYDAYTHAIYPGLPLGTLTRDDDPDVYDLVDAALLAQWHAATFHIGQVIPVVAGPIDLDTAARLIDQVFADLPSLGTGEISPPPQANFETRAYFLEDPSVSNGYAQFWGEVQPGGDLSSDAANALAGLLFSSGGLGAPLFEALRTQLRATYGFSSFFDETASGQGMTMFRGDIAPEVLDQVPAIVGQAYATYLTDGADPAQVNNFTQRVGAGIASRFQNARAISALAADTALNRTGTLTQALSSYALFATRTPEDVNSALSQNFPPAETLSSLLVGPIAPEGFEGCVIASADEALLCD